MKKIFALLPLILAALSGCHDGRNDCILACVPSPVVRYSIPMSSYEGTRLDFDSYIVLEGGGGAGGGLIVVKSPNGGYRAYDRNPPDLCPGQDTRLEVHDLLIVCPKNQAEWGLFTGIPRKGTSCPLIEYYAEYDPMRDEVRISNW